MPYARTIISGGGISRMRAMAKRCLTNQRQGGKQTDASAKPSKLAKPSEARPINVDNRFRGDAGWLGLALASVCFPPWR